MVGRCNPFNIRDHVTNHWLGSIGSYHGFVEFSSMDYGVRAACVLVMCSYRKENVLTIAEIINRFAPPSENNTQKYIDFVCARMSSFPFHIPERFEYASLLSAMSVYEGNPVSIDFISSVIGKFNIEPYKK